MNFTTETEIRDLVGRFESRTLPKSEWTHAAHLVVGLHYVLRHPFGVARNLMRDGIHWLNDAHGTPNTETSGYHETLTVFWLTKVNDVVRDKGGDIVKLAHEVIDKLLDRDLPLDEYSCDLLFSPEARARYVEPDIRRSKMPVATPV